MKNVQPATLNTIAEYLGVNASWLSERFNKETDMSISEYVNRIRIEETKKLLSETEKSIEEIQPDTGFGSLRHFTETFRKITGMTPLQYRHSLRNT